MFLIYIIQSTNTIRLFFFHTVQEQALLREFKRLDNYLNTPLPEEIDHNSTEDISVSKRKYLDGNSLTLADCNLLPKLHVIKVRKKIPLCLTERFKMYYGMDKILSGPNNLHIMTSSKLDVLNVWYFPAIYFEQCAENHYNIIHIMSHCLFIKRSLPRSTATLRSRLISLACIVTCRTRMRERSSARLVQPALKLRKLI